ncbi:putative protein AN7484 [Rhizoctonia solani AG-1 IB]|uniref:Polysaccharide lyase family 14 protein n=1 Tax=Thanatephorus cucumeris (strain AG1-IB / isolate 7/3/14) TaxID=1108050 RepID=M5CBD9_THACB|nr:putative protein AN7484 [Rhizoctonia solani AG-1 IB]
MLISTNPANVTLPTNFTLHALSKQDIWHPPEVPKGEEYNSPTYYVQYGPMQKFKSARVSICDMVGKMQYDQAGLIFLVNSQGLKDEKYESWFKTGVEIVDKNSTAKVMAAATPPGGFSDWGLFPLPSLNTGCINIEVQREEGGPGVFIYLHDGETKSLTRLVTWAFQKKFDKMLGVGAFVSRHNWAPGDAPFTGEPNYARFEGLTIDWSDWNGTTSQYHV